MRRRAVKGVITSPSRQALGLKVQRKDVAVQRADEFDAAGIGQTAHADADRFRAVRSSTAFLSAAVTAQPLPVARNMAVFMVLASATATGVRVVPVSIGC